MRRRGIQSISRGDPSSVSNCSGSNSHSRKLIQPWLLPLLLVRTNHRATLYMSSVREDRERSVNTGFQIAVSKVVEYAWVFGLEGSRNLLLLSFAAWFHNWETCSQNSSSGETNKNAREESYEVFSELCFRSKLRLRRERGRLIKFWKIAVVIGLNMCDVRSAKLCLPHVFCT